MAYRSHRNNEAWQHFNRSGLFDDLVLDPGASEEQVDEHLPFAGARAYEPDSCQTF